MSNCVSRFISLLAAPSGQEFLFHIILGEG